MIHIENQDTALIVNALREKAQGDRLGAASQLTLAYGLASTYPDQSKAARRLSETLNAQAHRADELADLLEGNHLSLSQSF